MTMDVNKSARARARVGQNGGKLHRRAYTRRWRGRE